MAARDGSAPASAVAARSARRTVARQEAVEKAASPGPWSWGAPPLKGWHWPDKFPSKFTEDSYLVVQSRNLYPAHLSVARELLESGDYEKVLMAETLLFGKAGA